MAGRSYENGGLGGKRKKGKGRDQDRAKDLLLTDEWAERQFAINKTKRSYERRKHREVGIGQEGEVSQERKKKRETLGCGGGGCPEQEKLAS